MQLREAPTVFSTDYISTPVETSFREQISSLDIDGAVIQDALWAIDVLKKVNATKHTKDQIDLETLTTTADTKARILNLIDLATIELMTTPLSGQDAQWKLADKVYISTLLSQQRPAVDYVSTVYVRSESDPDELYYFVATNRLKDSEGVNHFPHVPEDILTRAEEIYHYWPRGDKGFDRLEPEDLESRRKTIPAVQPGSMDHITQKDMTHAMQEAKTNVDARNAYQELLDGKETPENASKRITENILGDTYPAIVKDTITPFLEPFLTLYAQEKEEEEVKGEKMRTSMHYAIEEKVLDILKNPVGIIGQAHSTDDPRLPQGTDEERLQFIADIGKAMFLHKADTAKPESLPPEEKPLVGQAEHALERFLNQYKEAEAGAVAEWILQKIGPHIAVKERKKFVLTVERLFKPMIQDHLDGIIDQETLFADIFPYLEEFHFDEGGKATYKHVVESMNTLLDPNVGEAKTLELPAHELKKILSDPPAPQK